MQPVVRICQLEGIDNTPALPLAAGMLVASARLEPKLVEGYRFAISINRTRVQDLVESFGECAIIGFSLYPWNTVYSLAVIQETRRRWPAARIVVGGPSLPKRQEQVCSFLEAHVEIDVLVSGEGEVVFREYLLAELENRPLTEVGSLVYREGETLHFTTPASRVKDFRQTSSPYLDGTFDALMEAYPGHFTMGMLETNRGCPFLCTFCDWSLTKKVVELPLERVTAEIDWLASRGIANLCIVDANFGIRRRDHAIARHMAAARVRTQVPSFCYFYLTKNNYRKNLETIEIFRGAGIACSIGLAVQDFDDGVLSAVNRDNIQTSETFTLRRICAERGIPSRNEIIFGLPGQTYKTFSETVLKAMPPYPEHEAVIFVCRLLDNTELGTPEQRELHQIETRNCVWTARFGDPPGDVDERQELVVGTKSMPLEDWKRAYRFTYLASAGYNQYLMRFLFRVLPTHFGLSVRGFVEALLGHLEIAPEGSVFADIRQTFERYLDSILTEGPYMLAFEDGGDTNWDVDEAVTLCAFRDLDGFYAEMRAVVLSLLTDTDDRELFEELFHVQRRWIPNIGDTEPSTHTYAFDWMGLYQSLDEEAEVIKRDTTLCFQPPLIASIPTFDGFVLTYCGMMKARASTTTAMQGFRVEVEREDSRGTQVAHGTTASL